MQLKRLARHDEGAQGACPQPTCRGAPRRTSRAAPRRSPSQARFSRGHTTEWRYRGGKYVNPNTNAAAGEEFRPDTVLVLRVRQGDAGYLDPAGNPVPETIFTGKGKALLFHDGKVVRGTWTKESRPAPV